MRTSDRELVAALGSAIAQRIGEPRYHFWFERNTKFHCQEDLLVVGVPNHFYQEWLQDTFGEAVRAAASEVLGSAAQVRFTIDPELFQVARQAQSEVQSLPAADEKTQRLPERPRPPDQGKTPAPPARPASPEQAAGAKRTRHWHKLTEFVVGACNRVAHAAAVHVVEAPGQGPNPLVLHGPVGTGKTHLLEGIYAGLRKGHPDWRISFVTSEEFTNRFVQAMRLGKLSTFRKQYRDADALLVDDLHFLASKRATQEEFLHTFDVLQTAGKQVVVSCDCHPKLGEEFTPELTDRLMGGAVWGLTPPDGDTRLALVRAKAARGAVPVPEDVLRHLASQLRGNVRELEGALHSLQHFSRIAGRPIDLALAREALADLFRHAIRTVQLADVDRAVCRVLRLEAGTLQSKQRAWAVSHPRMLGMYLARRHTSAAYSEIGRYFGGRNHSTVVAAEKKVRTWLQADQHLEIGEHCLRIREVIELMERELRR